MLRAGDICEVVYRQGQAFVPPHIDGSTDPTRVPEVLGGWIAGLADREALKAALKGVADAVARRPPELAM